MSVEASATILTGVGHQVALIDIFGTELTGPFRFALAVIGVHPIYASSSIKATMVWTVVDVLLTVLAAETWQTGTLVVCASVLDAGPAMMTW